MSRFNVRPETHTNFEGSEAFKLDPQMALYSTVCTSMLMPKYYRQNTEAQLNELRYLISNNDPEFVARLAVYAREKMFMRTIPLVLVVELARLYNRGSALKKAVARVVARPDEIVELIAYYMKANDRTNFKRLSKQLSKGLKIAFNKFNEYQFAKWNRDGQVKLSDALRMVRPVPKSEDQGEIFQKICTNTLAVPYTWESEFANLGRELNKEILKYLYEETGLINLDLPEFTSLNKLLTTLSEISHPEYDTVAKIVESARLQAKKGLWEQLIDSDKMGYQATLMNVRNFLKYDVSMGHIQKVADKLADNAVNSKMFPFRFLSAYRALKGVSSRRYNVTMEEDTSSFNLAKVDVIVDGLERAVAQSIDNVDLFDGSRVCIACDVSGSMMSPISAKSTITNYDIGLVMGLLLKRKYDDNAIVGIFGATWKVKDLGQNVLAGVNELYNNEGEVGYSTNGYKVLEYLLQNDVEVDKVMMFTDCQNSTLGWNISNRSRDSKIPTLWVEYKRRFPNAKLYLFDLSGHGDTPIRLEEGDVSLIAGFSPEIFNVLKNIEEGKSALENINMIEL